MTELQIKCLQPSSAIRIVLTLFLLMMMKIVYGMLLSFLSRSSCVSSSHVGSFCCYRYYQCSRCYRICCFCLIICSFSCRCSFSLHNIANTIYFLKDYAERLYRVIGLLSCCKTSRREAHY